MKDIRIESPLGGQLIALAEVKDAAFAAGSMSCYRGSLVPASSGCRMASIRRVRGRQAR